MHKRKRGEYWEKYAADFLQGVGYKIVTRNWTCRWGEIDIVARDDSGLVFVEVKYRGSGHSFSPHEVVGYHKRKAQFRAIQRYLLENDAFDGFWRFDVVFLTKKSGRVLIDHYQAVPLYQQKFR